MRGLVGAAAHPRRRRQRQQRSRRGWRRAAAGRACLSLRAAADAAGLRLAGVKPPLRAAAQCCELGRSTPQASARRPHLQQERPPAASVRIVGQHGLLAPRHSHGGAARQPAAKGERADAGGVGSAAAAGRAAARRERRREPGSVAWAGGLASCTVTTTWAPARAGWGCPARRCARSRERERRAVHCGRLCCCCEAGCDGEGVRSQSGAQP